MMAARAGKPVVGVVRGAFLIGTTQQEENHAVFGING
jgi:hypothetical protein